MPALPIVLVHGYSDKGESFQTWCDIFKQAGDDPRMTHIGNYVSLSNEVSIKDIAEGFDRALHIQAGLSEGEPFDAVVHSTGMLVIREWLSAYAARQSRLKHLIGLAPATFGSPMAHKGRSWLGALFKGAREPGPDFMEAGDQVLAALELGSAYTWRLAHQDLIGDTAVYGPTKRTPYPFVFVGEDDYGWLKRAVTEPGTDGTVRWAGVGFNCRKIVMDLTISPDQPGGGGRVTVAPWANTRVPQVFLPDQNHSTIMREPSAQAVRLVRSALSVNSAAEYQAWVTAHSRQPALRRWQQFIVHAIDERGDGIRDYFIEIGRVEARRFKALRHFDLDVHAWRDDPSYRAFHVDLDKLDVEGADDLALRLIASSGSELVGYHGFSSPDIDLPDRDEGKWTAIVRIDRKIGDDEVAFFWPFTTTLIEIRLNREPMPLSGRNQVFWFS